MTHDTREVEGWEKEFFEKFGANKIWVTPSRDNVETVHEIFFFIHHQLQKARQEEREQIVAYLKQLKGVYSAHDIVVAAVNFLTKATPVISNQP